MADPDGYLLRTAMVSIHAVSEAMFPKNDLGAPDYEGTDLVRRTREYLDELPPEQRRLVFALFIFVELATPLLSLRFRRFSAFEPDRRVKLIQDWRSHWFQPFQWLGDALKATMTMMYFSHPAVVKHLQSFKTCERSTDPLQFPVDKDALKRLPVVTP